MSEELLSFMKELRSEIRKDFQESLDGLESRITENINSNIDEKFSNMQLQIQDLQQTNQDHEKRLAILEKQIRIRNIIFFGVEEGEKTYNELEQKILNIIKDKMGIPCDRKEIEIARRMGKKIENKTRPINITLTTFGKKIAILKNKKSLKDESIYVKEDYPENILAKRKSLQDQLQKEISEGKNAVLRYDKIIILNKSNRSHTQQNVEKDTNKKRELDMSPQNQYDCRAPGIIKKYSVAKKNKLSNNNKYQNLIDNYVQPKNDKQKLDRSVNSNDKTE